MINCLPVPTRNLHDYSTINPEVEARCRQAATSLGRSATRPSGAFRIDDVEAGSIVSACLSKAFQRTLMDHRSFLMPVRRVPPPLPWRRVRRTPIPCHCGRKYIRSPTRDVPGDRARRPLPCCRQWSQSAFPSTSRNKELARHPTSGSGRRSVTKTRPAATAGPE